MRNNAIHQPLSHFKQIRGWTIMFFARFRLRLFGYCIRWNIALRFSILQYNMN